MHSLHRQLITLAVLAAVTGCSAQPSREVADTNLAIADFVKVRGLEEVPEIRTTTRDGWDELTTSYVIYTTSRQAYLFEFVRPCWELRDQTRIVADERFDANKIRAKFETLRGCRIASIYPLNEAEAAELRDIGEPPGSRN